MQRWGLLGLGLLGLSACGASDGLSVTEISWDGTADAVALNQPLTLTVSERIQPGSVHESAITLVTSDDEAIPATGRWRVEGRRLTFQPSQPTAPRAGGSGLLPGRTYCLSLRGAPSLRTIRSTSGARLRSRHSWEFRTVEAPAGDPDEAWWLRAFVDPVPGVAPRLIEAETPSNSGEASLVWTFSEPLRPDDVLSARFRLRGPGLVPRGRDPQLEERLPSLEARLVDNQEGAVLSLTVPPALRSLLEAGATYRVEFDPGACRDFEGRPLAPQEVSVTNPRLQFVWPGTPEGDAP